MGLNDYHVPVLGISALSGTGKTTLLTGLIPQLQKNGIRVAVIKHAHHDFDIDKPGKDSYQIRQAGATPVILAGEQRTAIMIEKQTPSAPRLDELLTYIAPGTVDLVLIEGFKTLDFDKLFLFRHEIKNGFQELDNETLSLMQMDNVLAIITDIEKNSLQPRLVKPKPILDINNIEDITSYITNLVKREDL